MEVYELRVRIFTILYVPLVAYLVFEIGTLLLLSDSELLLTKVT